MGTGNLYELSGKRNPANAHLHDDERVPDAREVHVDSSWIASISYRGAGHLDAVDLVTLRGDHYRVFDVPWSVYWAWLFSPSKGTYFNAHIKDKYEISPI